MLIEMILRARNVIVTKKLINSEQEVRCLFSCDGFSFD